MRQPELAKSNIITHFDLDDSGDTDADPTLALRSLEISATL